MSTPSTPTPATPTPATPTPATPTPATPTPATPTPADPAAPTGVTAAAQQLLVRPGGLTGDELGAFTARGISTHEANQLVAAAAADMEPSAVASALHHYTATRVLTWLECLTYTGLTGPAHTPDTHR